ncbi:hypothetical protein T4C_5700 [Trichinella pseudospiralis]|uniref:Uncharacterized protein n=1 Tax=Trichinella pseudospiralis TaxID=6337 RepID=A0A0V1GC15_TRIPS|nr:hypothetical protein T4C_5700 [Trichinella pseudospiralis]
MQIQYNIFKGNERSKSFCLCAADICELEPNDYSILELFEANSTMEK